jgi:membrane-associated phospholipid phosphatase
MIKGIFEGRTTFFILYTLFLLVGIYFLNTTIHGEETLFFSRNHTPFWDAFFTFGTRLGEPYTYGALVVIMLFLRFGYAMILPIIGVVVSVISWPMKMFFKELRPYNYFNDNGLLSELNFVKGVRIFQDLTSFPSGHTMSGFALFGFLALAYGKNPFWQVLFFCCAMLVGISRMYLLQHFLNDVLAGSLVGVFLAMFVYYLHVLYRKPSPHWTTRKIKN